MKKQNGGFTLIEIMIAVVILTILSGASLAVLNSSAFKGRANDSQRIGDMKKLQTALELYFADHRHYPVAASVGWSAINATNPPLSDYITNNPTDPIAGRSYYYYIAAAWPLPSTYQICAGMETPTANAKCQFNTGCSGSITGNCCRFTNP